MQNGRQYDDLKFRASATLLVATDLGNYFIVKDTFGKTGIM